MLSVAARRPMVIGVVPAMSGSGSGEKLNGGSELEGAGMLFKPHTCTHEGPRAHEGG